MSSRPRNRIGGVIAVAVALAAVASGFGGGDDYVLRATFDEAAGLRKNSDVRIDGVRVGTVKRLELNEDDSVAAELSIDEGAAPVGRDARAYIRAKNLLGAKLVDIEPGDLSRPAPSGTRIPEARTGTPVELDDVLAVLDADTRTRMRILFHESGVALEGRGADFNRLLEQLPSSLDQAEKVLAEFAADNRALARLLSESDRVIGAMAGERASLAHFVEAAEGAFSTMASRRREVGETVRRAPAAVAQIRRTLARLEAAAVSLRPAAVAMRRTAPPLTAMLEQLPELAPAAVRTLSTAREVAPDLTTLAREGTPLVRRLRPTSNVLATFAVAFDPVSKTLDKGIADILATAEGWTRAIQGRDGLGHVFRGQMNLTDELALTLVERYVHPEAQADRRRSRRSPTAGGRERKRPESSARDDGEPASGPAIPELTPLRDLPGRLLGRPQASETPPEPAGSTTRLLDFLLSP